MRYSFYDRISQALSDFEFESLFIQVLGWDRLPPQSFQLEIEVGEESYSLRAIAHKRNVG